MRNANHRVGRRAARQLPFGLNRRIEFCGTVAVDQGHSPLAETFLIQKRIVHPRQYVDNRIADPEHIVFRITHCYSFANLFQSQTSRKSS